MKESLRSPDPAEGSPSLSSRELLDRIVMIRNEDKDPLDRTASDARIETLLAENAGPAKKLFDDFWREYIREQLKVRSWKQIKRLEQAPPEGDYPQNPVYPFLRQAVKHQLGGREESLERVIQDILDEFEPAQ